VFRNSRDKLPVALILGVTALDFLVYFAVDHAVVLLGYWLALLVPKGIICAWNHHHQHVATFRATPLNRAYELSLALHTGMTSNLWTLHHVLGHHLNYLDQRKDESGWQRRDGTAMGVIEYTLTIAFTAYYRGYLVGERYPRHQRVFVLWTAITLATVLALVAYRPFPALMVFALPMLTSLIFTAWVTYDHHTGLDTQTVEEASYNIMNGSFNRLTGNLGYHTAHHKHQAVHWSKLPELHATIAHKIPAHLYRTSSFDRYLPDAAQVPASTEQAVSAAE
jgi:fatty acid desaturase